MHFSFNLLRIKGLHMFLALLSYPQEGLHKRHFVYCFRITSVGCGTVAVSLQPCHSHLTLCSRNTPNALCSAPPEDKQVMVAPRWFHYTDIQQNIKYATVYLAFCSFELIALLQSDVQRVFCRQKVFSIISGHCILQLLHLFLQ
jgi:hypothetical protein